MALEAQDNPFPYITLVDTADPSTPTAGTKRLWVDTDDALKIMNEAGTVATVGGLVSAAAVSFTPVGTIAGTDTQTAVAEVATDAAAALSSHAAHATPAMVLLEQHTASASATLDFTTFISATYDEYMIEGVQIIAATNAQDLQLQCGSGAGPTWDTGNNYNWGATGINGSGTAVVHNGTTGIPVVFNSLANAAGYGHGSFTMKLFNPQSATLRRKFIGHRVFANTAVPAEHFQTFGIIWTNTSAAMTGVRFLMSSGNITSGTIRIYGVTK